MLSPRAAASAAYRQLPIAAVMKYGGSSLTNATNFTVTGGADVAFTRASSSITATPEALSLAPGESATES
jgi:hypothetical protein